MGRRPGAIFDHADAARASFVKAGLSDASFADANLAGACLDGAVAIGASFERADLRDVSFWTAILDGADLRGTNLAGARFERTVMDAAPRLGGAHGIETARVVSIVAGTSTLDGEAARTWLMEQAKVTP